MAGGFAHITAAAEALDRLNDIAAFSADDRMAIAQFKSFVDVGAVGPDYPYFGGQAGWADTMHYYFTGAPIRHGVRALKAMEEGGDRDRCLAWLLGYAAHVATDLSIHPIVELKVGEYATHKAEHRTCEMHQDVHIWQSRGLGRLGSADAFKIDIGDSSNKDGDMHPAVEALWLGMLQQTYPAEMTNDPPQLGKWNRGFRRIVDTLDDMGTYIPFTRHILAEHGAGYPNADEVDDQFIVGLKTPEGVLHYDVVFNRAVDSIAHVWDIVARGLAAQEGEEVDQILAQIPDGNLDTGRLLTDNTYIFWRPV